MKRSFAIFFVLTYSMGYAQPGKEAWHWFFGYYCQLDFSSGQPVAVYANYAYNEACVSLSDDKTGVLLFTSKSYVVFDTSLAVMSNGTNLLGHANSTQGALAFRKPGSAHNYYLITTDHSGLSKGAHYSEIDMSLNGGLGKVIVKNQVLSPPPVTEKMYCC